jgi:hypothetical protein
MDVGFHGDEADMIISLLPDVVMHLFLWLLPNGKWNLCYIFV